MLKEKLIKKIIKETTKKPILIYGLGKPFYIYHSYIIRTIPTEVKDNGEIYPINKLCKVYLKFIYTQITGEII